MPVRPNGQFSGGTRPKQVSFGKEPDLTVGLDVFFRSRFVQFKDSPTLFGDTDKNLTNDRCNLEVKILRGT